MLKPGEILTPMQGVEIRKNPKNRFVVFTLHYHADPAKRDPAYIAAIKASMPIRTFRQEYELVWDTFEGLPVYEDWDSEVHSVSREIKPHMGLPLLLGMDFGLTPAIAVCQLQQETLCVIREYTAFNMGVERFLRFVVPQLKIHFPLWQDLARDYLCFIDPSGLFRKDTDEKSCATIIEENGFRQIFPGPVKWDERKGAVEKWLTRTTKRGPCLRVSAPHCPYLVRGFQGGYRYPDKVNEKEPQLLRPIKDAHSHIHDAFQMVASKILSTKPASIVSIPRLAYSFETP